MNLAKSHAFLTALNEHNQKEWMDANRDWYQEARVEFIAFVDLLINGLQPLVPGMEGLKGKNCVFRINRDIRFSKDKRPYKNNFGAAISEGGRHSTNPSYYLHIQPGENFIGGGIYMPDSEVLKKIRQEVDYNPEDLKKIVEDSHFREAFGAVSGEKLVHAPKGYPRDHPNIEFLKLKSFVVMRRLPDAEVISEAFARRALEYFEVMKPFNDYLSVAVS